MGCCDDPTEPEKITRGDLVRIQEQYGNLQRDLFTGNPEKVISKELHNANTYLRELAALRAHFPSVRTQAIELLEKDSMNILQRIVDAEGESEIGQKASQRIAELSHPEGLFSQLFKT